MPAETAQDLLIPVLWDMNSRKQRTEALPKLARFDTIIEVAQRPNVTEPSFKVP